MATTPFRGEIYVHTNLLNGKSYVGQTTKGASARWGKHLTAARLPHHLGYNALIAKAIRKYGADAFEHQTLSIAGSAKELDNFEKIWIILLQTKTPMGYNITSGGSTWTPERLARMSARPREFSSEGREALRRNGRARRGQKQPREAVEKVAAMNRGRIKSPEERLRLSESHRGKTLSEETKQKISLSRLGQKDSPETRAKKSASSKLREAARRSGKGKEFNG